VSCLAFNAFHHDLLAAGSYSAVISLFDPRTNEALFLLHGHKGGLTQLMFSPDGNFLYSGARQDDQLYCWDVRYTQQALYCCERASGSTNQRIGFDIEPGGRYLATGGTDGRIKVSSCQGKCWPVFSRIELNAFNQKLSSKELNCPGGSKCPGGYCVGFNAMRLISVAPPVQYLVCESFKPSSACNL
jgi:WD40 repeat protein